MITVGVDPDVHFLSIAFFDDGKPLFAFVSSVPAKLRGVDAVRGVIEELHKYAPQFPAVDVRRVCVEGQQLYDRKSRDERKAKPADLLRLATVAGAAAYELTTRYPRSKLFIPLPQEWKGSVPKKIHQERTKTRIELADPNFLMNFPKAHQSHIIDACGMALWVAAKRVLTES